MFTFKGKTPSIRFELLYDNNECGARWKAKVGDYEVGLIRQPGAVGTASYVATLDGPMPDVPAGTPKVPFDPSFATLAFKADDDAFAKTMAASMVMEHVEASMAHWHAEYVRLIATFVQECPMAPVP